MPKETFLNLPAEKRASIENIAIKEFGDYGFDLASVNRIVSGAGIAKGSFYQYFEDKKDLFMYLLNQTMEKKMAYLSPIAFEPHAHDFFTLLRELFLSGLRFAMDNPERAKIGDWLMKNQEHEIFIEMMGESASVSNNFYLAMLKEAEEKGEVRKGLDLEYIGAMLTNLSVSLVNYVYGKTGVAFTNDENIMMEHVDAMIDLIKFGLINQGGQSDD